MPDDDVEPTIQLACPHCGYNVANIPDRRCPECGHMFDPLDLRREFLRARGVQKRAMREAIVVPVISGALVALWLGIGSLTGSGYGALLGVTCFFVLASLCVSSTSTLVPELIRARKALGHHQGWSEWRLVLLLGSAMLSLQIGLMLLIILLLISVFTLIL